jgi:hypothetical protein
MDYTSTSPSGRIVKPQIGKKRKTLFIISSILCTLFVLWQFCRKPILLSIYGIHQPRVENAQSILNTAYKYGVDTTGIVTVSPEGYNSLFGLFGNAIPEALVFDRQGKYIAYKLSPKACNAGLFSFIPALDKDIHYLTTTKITLNNELPKLRDLYGNALPQTYLHTNADFYIMVSWMACAGKLNEDHISKWEKLIVNNKKATIQVVAVNFDAQQWWPAVAQDSVLKKRGKI